MVARSPLADFTIRVVGCSNPITLETRQRQPNAVLESVLYACKQKSLFVNRQQYIEMSCGQ